MSTLFVSDLDGTLLDRQGGLSDVSRRALERLLDRGVPFTVASARSVISMQSVLLDLPIRLPVVCFNGGFVSELHTGRHLHVFPLAQDAAQGAHRMATARGLSVMVSTHTPQGDRLYVPTAHTPGIALYVAARQSFGDPRLRLVDDASVGLREDVTCLTAIAMRADLLPLVRDLQAAHGPALQLHLFDDLYTRPWSWLTMHAGTATKGRAVDRLMTEASLADHRLVAFGDQLNDLPLFERADHAVATANAVPDVLEAADEVIGAHHEDAVVRWLEQHA